ncbi:unnamed protein product [Dracunculus medinensis]|uniref:EF-hand domain-containing protein n=1 Tax=Dracunculus medinensis TaxID=318479 RepID=A0A0N4UFS3_DRAME|nr:unnamed protein product [Dracunculus medinensis]
MFLLFSIFLQVNSIKLGLFAKKYDSPVQSNYGPRPYGVSFVAGPLYATGENFTCIDGLKTIPFKHVNDDYCDCTDGSDEPGTSACPNGVFHCLNRGFFAENIPSSRVNDQICDCCDGSDEWNGAVHCENNCVLLGLERKARKEQRVLIVQKGYAKRLKLAEEAKKLKVEKQQEMDRLQNELNNITVFLAEIDDRKKEVEMKEQLAKNFENAKKQAEAKMFFDDLDLDSDLKVTAEELKNYKEFDTDNDGTILLEEEKEIAFDKFFKKFEILKYQFFKKRPILEKNPQRKMEITPGFNHEEVYEEDLKEMPEKNGTDFDDYNDNDGDDRALKDDSALDGPRYNEETLVIIAEADRIRDEYSEMKKRFDDVVSQMKYIFCSFKLL